MKAATEAGDSEAVERYEAHLPKHRDDYYKKKAQIDVIARVDSEEYPEECKAR